MKYFFLVAGRGTRMQPLTTNYPKTLFKLDKDTTIISRMIEMIRKYDENPKITIVTGFKHYMIEESVENVSCINNPFFAVTNSLASLWFAKEHLVGDSIIINGDVLVSEELMKEIVCKRIDRSEVLLDSSIRNDGDYNVEVIDNRVVVMSKGLNSYYGEFVGITRVDAKSVQLLKNEVETMIQNGQYDQWYEDAFIQMIFEHDFPLFYKDVCDYEWTEVDDVNDLLFARRIYQNDIRKK